MANKSLFSSLKSLLPRATVRNDAGGPAYALEPKHALAQLAAMRAISIRITHVLQARGYEVEVAKDGEECLARIPSFKPEQAAPGY